MNENKMTKRILLPFSLALFALLITSVAIIYWQQLNNVSKEVVNQSKQVQQLFKMKLDEDAKILESQINLLRLNKDLQKYYGNKEQKALLEYATPFFNTMNNDHQVTHFYFIGLDKVCFLRVHNPKRHGDLIPRFTLADAAKNNVPAYGIELGKFGTFTLRLVYPWYVNDELIGYIELGKEIEHITVAIKEILNVDLLFTINKSFLERSTWEEGLRMMQRRGDWEQFSDIVVIDKTIPIVSQEVEKLIDKILSHSTSKHFKTYTKFTFDNKQYSSMPIPIFDAGKRELGDVIVLIDISEQEKLLLTLLIVLITISIIIGLSLLRFFYVFISRIENELSKVHAELITVVQAASAGDFGPRINVEDKEGFFKQFAVGINESMDFNQSVIKDLMHITSALAEGNLTKKIENDYVGAFEQLKSDVNTTITKLTDVITAMLQTTKIVNAAADKISQSNFELSRRTESQASSLEETAASMEQMTATIQQNADYTFQAAELANKAEQKAKNGREINNLTIQAMIEISKSSKKISDIIGVIDEIAFQTNLLSLNAAVEAAHAGEQGRGFAVVATEVRNLAQRSATAAREIKDLITDSTVKVEEGTKLANNSGEILDKIVFSSKKVSDIISEIAAATQEQSSGIHQINTAILQLDNITQQNAALAGEADSIGSLVKEQAQKLEKQVAFFNVGEHTKK